MNTRPKKDLIEIFGYAPDDMTTQCRSLWNLSACPFINKQCTKTNHDGSIIYGTCSVSSPYGDCIICPNRLYENDYSVEKESFIPAQIWLNLGCILLCQILYIENLKILLVTIYRYLRMGGKTSLQFILMSYHHLRNMGNNAHY